MIYLSVWVLFFIIMLLFGKGRSRYLLLSGFTASILTKELSYSFPDIVQYYQNIELTFIIFLAITVVIGFSPKASKGSFGFDTLLLALTGSVSILINGLNAASIKAQTIANSQSTIINMIFPYKGWILLVAGASIVLVEILKKPETKKIKKK